MEKPEPEVCAVFEKYAVTNNTVTNPERFGILSMHAPHALIILDAYSQLNTFEDFKGAILSVNYFETTQLTTDEEYVFLSEAWTFYVLVEDTYESCQLQASQN